MTQEQLRMQMLAGIITEGQYKTKLNEEKNYIESSWNGQPQISDDDFLNFLFDLLQNAGYEIPDRIKEDMGEEAHGGDLTRISDDYPLSYWENFDLQDAKKLINDFIEIYKELDDDYMQYNNIEDFKV